MADCKRLLLVGWNAADWKLILPLLDAGKLPVLGTLIEHGVIGKMTSVIPNHPCAAWTSVATGKEPFKHRVLGGVEPMPGGKGVRGTTCLSRRGKTLWNILGQHSWRCQLVAWPASHPAEPLTNGAVISEHFPRLVRGPNQTWPMLEGTIFPPGLVAQLAELRMHPGEISGHDLVSFVPRLAQMEVADDPRLAQLAGTVAESVSLHAAATELMDTRPWDFHAVYYPGIHRISQLFMNYHPPKPEFVSDEDFEMFQHVVEAAYVFHDQMLGALVERAGDEATIVVLSDQGFHSGELRHNAPLDEPGAPPERSEAGTFVMRGPGILKDHLAYGTSILDITPTLLHHCGLPVGRDMDGKVLTSIFETPAEPVWVDSWDDVDGADGRHPAAQRYDPLSVRVKRDTGDEQIEVARRTHIEWRYNLALSCIACHREGAAVEMLESIWAEDPEDTRYAYQLMICYMAIGRPAEARHAFDRLLENKKRYAVSSLAAWRELDARDQHSLTEYERTLKLKLWKQSRSNLSGMGFLHAWLLHAEGEIERALEVISATDEEKVFNLIGLLKLKADCLFQSKRFSEAEAVYQRITEIDREYPEAYLGLAKVYFAQERFREAAANARTSISFRFYNPLGHYVYGGSIYRCGQPQAAADALEIAVAQAPRLIGAYQRLVALHEGPVKDQDKAEHYKMQLERAKKDKVAFEERRRGPLDERG